MNASRPGSVEWSFGPVSGRHPQVALANAAKNMTQQKQQVTGVLLGMGSSSLAADPARYRWG